MNDEHDPLPQIVESSEHSSSQSLLTHTTCKKVASLKPEIVDLFAIGGILFYGKRRAHKRSMHSALGPLRCEWTWKNHDSLADSLQYHYSRAIHTTYSSDYFYKSKLYLVRWKGPGIGADQGDHANKDLNQIGDSRFVMLCRQLYSWRKCGETPIHNKSRYKRTKENESKFLLAASLLSTNLNCFLLECLDPSFRISKSSSIS